jgi:hypothetical protein
MAFSNFPRILAHFAASPRAKIYIGRAHLQYKTEFPHGLQNFREKIRALIRQGVFVAKDTCKRQALFAPVAFPMCCHAASSGGAAPNARVDHLAEVREDRNGCAPGEF